MSRAPFSEVPRARYRPLVSLLHHRHHEDSPPSNSAQKYASWAEVRYSQVVVAPSDSLSLGSPEPRQDTIYDALPPPLTPSPPIDAYHIQYRNDGSNPCLEL